MNSYVFCNGNLDCLKTEVSGNFGRLGGFEKFVYERDAARSVKIGIGVDYLEKDFDFGSIGPLIKQPRKCFMHESMQEYLNVECRSEDERPRHEPTELPFDGQVDKFKLVPQERIEVA